MQAKEHAYSTLQAGFQHIHQANGNNPAYLQVVQAIGEQLQQVQNASEGMSLMLAFKALVTARRRQARHIRVQPTSIARRRPGLTRGSKRVPAGRPASEPSSKRLKKRPHSLQQNIRDNVPSARLH